MCWGVGRSNDPGLTIAGLGSVEPALNEDTPCSPSNHLDSFSLSHPNAALVVVFFASKHGFVVALDIVSEGLPGAEGKNSSASGGTKFCPVGGGELTGLRVITEDLKGFD